MCAQLGLLITLKSVYRKAEKRVQANTPEVDFQCGDFNKEESYWKLPETQFSVLPGCMQENCPESLWVNPKGQEKALHVVAVEKARPSYWKDGSIQYGHFVDVQVRETAKPLTLVLLSQGLMQWNLKFPEKQEKPDIEEVIVIGPELVWLEGLDEKTKVTYFNEKQICSFPYAWEEIHNPQNQFRRLFLALKEYTGQEISSFQGRSVGRQFQLPYRNVLAADRGLKPSLKRSLASLDGLGLQWKRVGERLVPTEYLYKKEGKSNRIEVPEKTQQAYYEWGQGTLFLIYNHQFGTWNEKDKKFTPVHLPMSLPAMNWPRAMTFNPLNSEILIYNDDRGGEILAYNVVTKKWRVFAEKVGYSLLALAFDTEEQKLLGARFSASQISAIIELNKSGQLINTTPLQKPIAFAKSRWHLQIYRKNAQSWLEVIHPAQPGGEAHPL
jgi:hypothetical protein